MHKFLGITIWYWIINCCVFPWSRIFPLLLLTFISCLYFFVWGWGLVNFSLSTSACLLVSSTYFRSKAKRSLLWTSWRRLPFMVPESTIHTFIGGKQSTVLSSYDVCEPQQWPTWHDNIKGTVAACVLWWWPTALKLSVNYSQQYRNHAWYWKTSQLCKASEVINHRGETATAPLIDQNNP